MKLRNLLVLAAGFLIGYQMGKRSMRDDPQVLKGPQSDTSSGNPALRVISGQAQKLADRATGKSVDAIKSARRALQNRMAEAQNDTAW